MQDCSIGTDKCPKCGQPFQKRVLPAIPGAPNGIVIISKCQCIIRVLEEEERQIKAAEQQKKINQLVRESQLGEREKLMTFQNFKVNQGNKGAYNAAVKFVKEWPRKRGMMLLGTVGNGKTHLGVAIMHVLMPQGVPCMFVSVPELLAAVRASYSSKRDNTELDIVRAAQTVGLLVLDDLGAERITEYNQEFVQEILFRIVNWRYRHDMPIIATTNSDLDLMAERVGARIWSRMVEVMDMVSNNASDYRLKMAGLGGE